MLSKAGGSGSLLLKVRRSFPRNSSFGKLPVASSSTTAATFNSAQDSSAKRFDEIPGPKGLPFIGTLLDYRIGQYRPTTFHKALLDRHKQYGKIFKQKIMGRTTVHLLDPEFYRVWFQSEDKTPHIVPLLEPVKIYRKKRNFAAGLGNSNGEEWYKVRSAIQQLMMRPKEVTEFFHMAEGVATDFLERIRRIRDKNGEVGNFLNEAKKWTLETSSMTCFEKRLGALECQPGSELQKTIDINAASLDLSTKLYFSLPIYKYFSTPAWRDLIDKQDSFHGKAKELVDATTTKIQDLMKKGELKDGQYGFMTYLLSRKDLEYKDAVIIALSLIGDGLITTSPATVGQLYCLATNPAKQEKLYEEVCREAPKGEPLTSERINRMPYLKACVKEAFRFFPTGPDVKRVVMKDTMIGGYTIPKGTNLEMNNFALLRSSEYFDDPEDYLPERWLRGESAHNIHPYLLTPFGYGTRMCPGRRFAEQDMYIIITKLIQNFKIRWNSKEVLSQEYKMVFIPDRPATFAFLDRE
ncbi:probable cytochrome P450 CYP44 [Lineus longissimus]|uniref:probable cytochrome P450 CYP44 n=1 Tax=Lineus longissimus TaxID=88925 RepID=UPI00315DE906